MFGWFWLNACSGIARAPSKQVKTTKVMRRKSSRGEFFECIVLSVIQFEWIGVRFDLRARLRVGFRLIKLKQQGSA